MNNTIKELIENKPTPKELMIFGTIVFVMIFGRLSMEQWRDTHIENRVEKESFIKAVTTNYHYEQARVN
jgi:hypothetical protein